MPDSLRSALLPYDLHRTGNRRGIFKAGCQGDLTNPLTGNLSMQLIDLHREFLWISELQFVAIGADAPKLRGAIFADLAADAGKLNRLMKPAPPPASIQEPLNLGAARLCPLLL